MSKKITDLTALTTPEADDYIVIQEDSSGITKKMTYANLLGGATAAEVAAVCDGNTATAAEITSVCDGNTATAAEIVAACDGIGVTIPKPKLLSFSAWNMDTTATKAVAHGVTHANICSVTAEVFANDGATSYPAGSWASILYDAELFMSVGATNVNLYRTTGGFFDSVAFNAAYGKIIVWYID